MVQMLFCNCFQLEYFFDPFNTFIYHSVVIFQMIGKMIGDFSGLFLITYQFHLFFVKIG